MQSVAQIRVAPPSRSRRTVMLMAAGAAVLVAVVLVAMDWLVRDTTVDTTVFDESISAVDVDISAGSVSIVGTDDSSVVIERTQHSGLREPKRSEVVRDGRLVIRASCPTRLVTRSCSVDYIVRVPRDVDLIARSDGADIDAAGLVGGADVTTNGGEITVAFGGAPDRIEATTNGGSIVLELPENSPPYHVEARSDGGSTDVDVRADPASERRIDAHSSGGEVIVRYAGG